jgi:uncharacterized phage protein (TIGR01671 family)
MSRLKYRVYNTKRECYEDSRNHAIDRDGVLYEFKSGLKPVNMDIRVIEFCAGLKDKNGKLIYDGDLVQSGIGVYPTSFNLGAFGIVIEYDSQFLELSGMTQVFWDECEIIGNIHESKGID